MKYEGILYDIKDNIAKITLNMAEKRNRLSTKAMTEIIDALEKATKDEKAKVVIITGAGGVFCAGADLAGAKADTAMDSREEYSAYAKLCTIFNTLGKPSIAAVNGLAVAGGLGLAIYPDITIASGNAKFGTPEINVGMWPMMVSASLSRAVGRKKALELMYTGDIIDAYEAQRIGLVNQVVPEEKLEERVMALANKLRDKSPVILRLGRDAFYQMQDLEFSKAVEYLRDMIALLLSTEDSQEGIAAFLEKRKPVWKGR
jgi:enoyl-CoA hydratase/carnithine racemase